MSHWNYRVVKHVDDYPPHMHQVQQVHGPMVYYDIHEVHYDPIGPTENAVSAQGRTSESLKADLHRMLEAFDRPILTMRNGELVEDE